MSGWRTSPVPGASVELRRDEGGVGGDFGVVAGWAVRFDDTARVHGFTESVRRGSLRIPDDVPVVFNLGHDRARPLARMPDGGLQLEERDEGWFLKAAVHGPDAHRALSLVRTGLAVGLSLEVVNQRWRPLGGVAVLHGDLIGVGLVTDAAYKNSAAAIAQRSADLAASSRPRRRLDVPW